MPTQPITVNRHWRHKRSAAEVIVIRASLREVSYIAVDKTFSGTVSQWVSLEGFQPVAQPKKKVR